jgi:predicted nucleic acid-binding protein
MIVVDVNVLAYLWIKGEWTPSAEKALLRDALWAAPLLWRSEFRNILAGCIRRKNMPPEMAFRCLEGAEAQMAGHEFLVGSDKIMRLVPDCDCTAYDCEYAALAEDLGVPLVTADKQLLKAFPRRAVSLRDFAG